MFKKSPSFSKKRKKFNVIILASGLGKRLRPETNRVPKPMVALDSEGAKSIDYLIEKFKPVAERLIVATAYLADVLENHVKEKYPDLNLFFSREKVSELKSPARSSVFALDYASSALPTIVMFSDYIIEDYIPVDRNALCITKKPESPYVIETSTKCIPLVKKGIITDMIPNKELRRYGGWPGLGIFHDTLLLKSIAFARASKDNFNMDFGRGIVKDYVKKVRTWPIYISKMYEFGTVEMLKKVREAENLC